MATETSPPAEASSKGIKTTIRGSKTDRRGGQRHDYPGPNVTPRESQTLVTANVAIAPTVHAVAGRAEIPPSRCSSPRCTLK